MTKINRYITTLLFISLCVSSYAQGVRLIDMASPKLKSFLVERPKDFQYLTNAFAQAFKGKTIELLYFYTEDQSMGRSYQIYPDDSTVNICICENQEPVDQFICLLFETLNSEGEERFMELSSKAATGEISKQAYVRGLAETEFEAIKKTRDIIKKLNFKKRDISASSYYERFIKCPDAFNDYLAYAKSISTNFNSNYEADYDVLRRQGRAPGHAENQ